MLRLLPCRSFRWTQVRHCAAKETVQRLHKEICKALGSSTSWIPVSRVSSFLADETCEALAELGGLAGFCTKLCKEDEGPRIYVKSVDGVLCLRQNKERVFTKKHKNTLRPDYTKQLMEPLMFFPHNPANLASCQRVWKLESTRDVLTKISELIGQMDSLLAEHFPDVKDKNLVQVGYHGKDILCVSQRIHDSLNMEGSVIPGWDVEDFSPIYDLWRMSRYLRTDAFVPINTVRQTTAEMLQTPLLQVALTYPERIKLQLGAVAQEAEADRLYVNGDAFGERREVIGLKFILTEREKTQYLKTMGKLSTLTDAELSAERQKLKEIPPLRRQKKRRSIVREEFRRKFPEGNPFLNEDIVALHLYDSMDPGVFYNNANLRESFLPDGGKATMHVGVDFFEKHPHLFISQGVTTTSVNVMRREQEMSDVQSEADKVVRASYSDEDILLALIARLSTKKEDWCGTERKLEVYVGLLPRHIFKFLQSKGPPYCFVSELLKRYPETFEISGDAPGSFMVRVHTEMLGKLGVQLVNQASDTEAEKKKDEEQKSEEV